MMRISSFAIALGAMGLLACAGGETASSVDGGGISFVDAAGSQVDAQSTVACNPVANTGCQPGEKCTFVIDSPMGADSITGSTRCAPDGDKAAGASCTGSSGGTADDCLATTYCSGGVCAEICSSGPPDTCPEGQGACVHTSGIFEDSTIGFCSGPACDLLSQDCTGPHAVADNTYGAGGENDSTESCYMLWSRPGAPTTCFSAYPDDGQMAPGGQDTVCNYINTCLKGYGCDMPSTPPAEGGQIDSLSCSKYCDALGTSGVTCSRPGDKCYQHKYYWSGADDVAENIGFCADGESFGPTPLEQMDAGE
jgi:hypothetical protein